MYINIANSIIKEIESKYMRLINMRINPLAEEEFFRIKFNKIDMIINNIYSECSDINNNIYSNISSIRNKEDYLYRKIFEYGFNNRI